MLARNLPYCQRFLFIILPQSLSSMYIFTLVSAPILARVNIPFYSILNLISYNIIHIIITAEIWLKFLPTLNAHD